MAIPNSSYTEAVTTAIANYRDTFADNITNHNAFLYWLKKGGNTDPADGGNELLENLQYAENATAAWYSGYDTLSVEGSDTLTSANFAWKQANCNVTISGLEKMKNSGKSRMHALLKARIQVAEATMQNTIGAALFYSNTEQGGKAIGGLQHLVSDTPTTGTVGGIDASVQAFWQNYVYDFSSNSVTAGSTTIQHAMNLCHVNTVRGNDSVDLIIAGNTYFTYYEESLQSQQRFQDTNTADGGFVSYRYKNARVFSDENCSATRMYMLNSKYIFFRPHKDRNFIVETEKMSVNQDAIVVPMYWGGNCTISNRARQAVICA